jgi:hypothetical protein
MNKIINFIARHIRREQPTQLGRWTIDYCTKQIHNKVDLANVDHCGTCGDYLIKKIESHNNSSSSSPISNFKTNTK